MALLPSKFAVDYVTPRQDQAQRGTCWDFATIGFLEQSYREHGVKKGWLSQDEYVHFSEQVNEFAFVATCSVYMNELETDSMVGQAYGVEIIELCTGSPDSQQQINCRVAGDEVGLRRSSIVEQRV